MATDSSLPSYDRLFRDLDLRGVDDARSVFSPAAYLADLLQLLHDHFEDPDLVQRRPTIEGVPLDAERTYTVLPYLDIVNEVLAASLGPDAFDTLKKLRHPAALPFVLQHDTVKELLGRLEVDAAELYALFATTVEPNTTARLRLGLSTEEADALVTPIAATATPADAEVFRRANGLSAVDLRTVLATTFVGGAAAALDGGVRDRTVRFVRLARTVGLSFPELDLVLRSCCEDVINRATLRTVAALVAVGRSADLPVDVVCSLVAPIDTTGLDGTAPLLCSARGNCSFWRSAGRVSPRPSSIHVTSLCPAVERSKTTTARISMHGTIPATAVSCERLAQGIRRGCVRASTITDDGVDAGRATPLW